jgi:hypothetical protein
VRLKAKVLKIEVKKNPGYDKQTGNPDPSYFLEATVVDVETLTKYQCSFRDALAERLRQAYNEKIPETARDALATEVETIAKQQLENQEVILEVEEVRVNKDFITLLVKRID